MKVAALLVYVKKIVHLFACKVVNSHGLLVMRA